LRENASEGSSAISAKKQCATHPNVAASAASGVTLISLTGNHLPVDSGLPSRAKSKNIRVNGALLAGKYRTTGIYEEEKTTVDL
jgi:hypothetical protein